MNDINERLQRLILANQGKTPDPFEINELNKFFSKKLDEICLLMSKDLDYEEQCFVLGYFGFFRHRNKEMVPVKYDNDMLIFCWENDQKLRPEEDDYFSLSVPVKWFLASNEELQKYIDEYIQPRREKFNEYVFARIEREYFSIKQKYERIKMTLGM